MMFSLLLVSATLLANPVFISEVKATREAGHLRVDVVGDGGIDPDLARTMLNDDVLLIYLGGARVRADNRSWPLADGNGEIRAHRHRGETELVIPIGRNGCAGPVELTGSESGISALVGCDGRAAAPAKTAQAVTAPIAVKASPRQETAGNDVVPVVAKKPIKLGSEQDQLKALVELPPAAAAGAVEADSDAPAAVIAAAKSASVRLSVAVPAAAAVVPLAAVAAAPEPRAATPEPVARVASATSPTLSPSTAPSPAPSLSTSRLQLPSPTTTHVPTASLPSMGLPAGSATTGGVGPLRAVALPALLLMALAIGAFVIARRRRTVHERHIQILETTSLGPKRSLILARVGDDTLILASSEAGITLLKSHAGPEAAKVAASPEGRKAAEELARAIDTDDEVPAVMASSPEDFNIEISQPLEEALADIPQPTGGQGGQSLPGRNGFRTIEGGLAGLFRSRVATGARAEVAQTFDDVLEDSVEDQELRRKLAAGMSTRAR